MLTAYRFCSLRTTYCLLILLIATAQYSLLRTSPPTGAASSSSDDLEREFEADIDAAVPDLIDLSTPEKLVMTDEMKEMAEMLRGAGIAEDEI